MQFVELKSLECDFNRSGIDTDMLIKIAEQLCETFMQEIDRIYD